MKRFNSNYIIKFGLKDNILDSVLQLLFRGAKYANRDNSHHFNYTVYNRYGFKYGFKRVRE